MHHVFRQANDMVKASHRCKIHPSHGIGLQTTIQIHKILEAITMQGNHFKDLAISVHKYIQHGPKPMTMQNVKISKRKAFLPTDDPLCFTCEFRFVCGFLKIEHTTMMPMRDHQGHKVCHNIINARSPQVVYQKSHPHSQVPIINPPYAPTAGSNRKPFVLTASPDADAASRAEVATCHHTSG